MWKCKNMRWWQKQCSHHKIEMFTSGFYDTLLAVKVVQTVQISFKENWRSHRTCLFQNKSKERVYQYMVFDKSQRKRQTWTFWSSEQTCRSLTHSKCSFREKLRSASGPSWFSWFYFQCVAFMLLLKTVRVEFSGFLLELTKPQL